MTTNRTLEKVGKRLREARLRLNLTQLEVAEKAGVSVNYYSRIERGEVNQSIETFEAITQVLRVKSFRYLTVLAFWLIFFELFVEIIKIIWGNLS